MGIENTNVDIALGYKPTSAPWGIDIYVRSYNVMDKFGFYATRLNIDLYRLYCEVE